MTFETKRLILREYTPADFDALYEILSDEETMAHYPGPMTQTASAAGSLGTKKTTEHTALVYGPSS